MASGPGKAANQKKHRGTTPGECHLFFRGVTPRKKPKDTFQGLKMFRQRPMLLGPVFFGNPFGVRFFGRREAGGRFCGGLFGL